MKDKRSEKTKQKLFLTVLFWIIAFISIWIIISQNKDFSFMELVKSLAKMNPIYVVLAVISMFLYIYTEGKAIKVTCNFYNYKIKMKDAFTYAASDIYFSAITPSSSGGQPACAYLMIKDKLPGVVVSIALIYNVIMCSLATVLIAIVSTIIFPKSFFNLNVLSKVLIVIGFITQSILILFFYLLLVKDKFLERILIKGLNILEKMHFIKNSEEKKEKLKKKMDEYYRLVSSLKDEKKIIGQLFFWNLFQRIAQIGVIVFLFIGLGGNLNNIFGIFNIQSLALIGSFALPIPGGIGVIDYLMLNGFNIFMNKRLATNLELVGRSLSFYLCIIICGIVIIFKYLKLKKEC